MKTTCFIAGHEVLSSAAYLDLFTYAEDSLGFTVVHKLSENPDVVLYGGGVDINPKLYGKKFDKKTGQPPFLLRDGIETFTYQFTKNFMTEKTPLSIGICRGAQLLNCLNGGTLDQHIEGHVLDWDGDGDPPEHEGVHAVEYLGKNKKDTFGVRVNSLHHQRMVPPSNGNEKHNPYEVLVRTLDLEKSLEALWFPKTRCLCIQWHPEYDPDKGSGFLAKRLIEDYGGLS